MSEGRPGVQPGPTVPTCFTSHNRAIESSRIPTDGHITGAEKSALALGTRGRGYWLAEAPVSMLLEDFFVTLRGPFKVNWESPHCVGEKLPVLHELVTECHRCGSGAR